MRSLKSLFFMMFLSESIICSFTSFDWFSHEKAKIAFYNGKQEEYLKILQAEYKNNNTDINSHCLQNATVLSCIDKNLLFKDKLIQEQKNASRIIDWYVYIFSFGKITSFALQSTSKSLLEQRLNNDHEKLVKLFNKSRKNDKNQNGFDGYLKIIYADSIAAVKKEPYESKENDDTTLNDACIQHINEVYRSVTSKYDMQFQINKLHREINNYRLATAGIVTAALTFTGACAYLYTKSKK